MSTFTVREGMEDAVRGAFAERVHLVDGASGFVRMDVMTSLDDARQFWLLTYWEDEESYRAWHRSHAYHESHRGIPKGLKLVPGSSAVRLFAYVTD